MYPRTKRSDNNHAKTGDRNQSIETVKQTEPNLSVSAVLMKQAETEACFSFNLVTSSTVRLYLIRQEKSHKHVCRTVRLFSVEMEEDAELLEFLSR